MTQAKLSILAAPHRRGSRAWLLAIKVLAVIVYVGGLATVLGLWVASDFASLDLNDPRRALVLHQVSRLMVFLVVPALLVAIVCGISLLMISPARFLRTRWLQFKLASLIILIPCSHLYCRMHFTAMKAATEKLASDANARQFTLGLIAALIGSIFVVIISRLKPRLGAQTESAGEPAAHIVPVASDA